MSQYRPDMPLSEARFVFTQSQGNCPCCDRPYPRPPRGRARRSDPDTSHQAARAITPAIGAIQRAVLGAFQQLGPIADFELEAALREQGHYAYSTVRTRRGELVEMGILSQTNIRRRSPSGRECIVWALRFQEEK